MKVRDSKVLPFDERETVYKTLAVRALAAFPHAGFPLSAKLFRLLLTEGTSGLVASIGICTRTLHRLLQRDGLGALELRHGRGGKLWRFSSRHEHLNERLPSSRASRPLGRCKPSCAENSQ